MNNLHPIFAEILKPFAPAPSQQYTGTLISDLDARVDNALELSRIANENSRLCGRCRRTLGEHSHGRHECPQIAGPLFSNRTFQEIRCQANVGRHENISLCEQECTPGAEYCPTHLEGSR